MLQDTRRKALQVVHIEGFCDFDPLYSFLKIKGVIYMNNILTKFGNIG